MEQLDPIAIELNRQIKQASPAVYDCLSKLGKQIFFPRGILTQSAEAKKKAHRFNATIGIALENGEPMHLNIIRRYFDHLALNEVFTYAPPEGRPELRRLWQERLLHHNPTLRGKRFSRPIVTSALTHGLSLAADLFINPGDVILAPDKMWGVYPLNFVTRKEGRIATFPMFDAQGSFNTPGFAELLQRESKKNNKIIALLSFPNNPTGYTPTVAEAEALCRIIEKRAKAGIKIITLSDDAYFGLFYEDSIKESLFGHFCNLHENVVAVKVDGATKESYVWGFRTGFITLGTRTGEPDVLYEALEAKLKGIIRSTISSCNHPSQSIIEKVLQDPEYDRNLVQKFAILRERARRLKELLSRKQYENAWDYYPFNSGYFMSLKLKGVDAERLRCHLLDRYGVGTVSMGETDLRIAFSCIEADQLEELIETIYRAVLDLKNS